MRFNLTFFPEPLDFNFKVKSSVICSAYTLNCWIFDSSLTTDLTSSFTTTSSNLPLFAPPLHLLPSHAVAVLGTR